jgi:hypothetical protein
VEFSMKKGIRTIVKMGQVYDFVPFASVLWPENGPYILIERIGATSTWRALNVQTCGLDTIIPSDETIYERIA